MYECPTWGTNKLESRNLLILYSPSGDVDAILYEESNTAPYMSTSRVTQIGVVVN